MYFLNMLTTHYLLFAFMLLFLAINTALSTLAEGLQLVQDGTESYKFAPLHMTGTIGGIVLNHTGTVQEIYAQLTTENPDFNLAEVDDVAEPVSVEARDKRSKSDWKCIPVPGQLWTPADPDIIDNGIAYLRKVKALCWVDGHACSRISCSYNSAISLCNVTPNKMGLSCTYMASYAQDLRDRCSPIKGYSHSSTGGQAWDTDGYNVNVYRDRC